MAPGHKHHHAAGPRAHRHFRVTQQLFKLSFESNYRAPPMPSGAQATNMAPLKAPHVRMMIDGAGRCCVRRQHMSWGEASVLT